MILREVFFAKSGMSEISIIESISDLEGLVLNWENKFLNPGEGFPAIWYRGQPRDLPPQPGILRSKFLASCDDDEFQMEGTKGNRLWNKERTFNRQFRRMSSSHVSSGLSLVDIYLFAQHHGIPTRLLDWSMNPLAAVFFAASGRPNEDGAIYVMNAKELGDFAEMRDPRAVSTVDAVFGDAKITMPASIIAMLPNLHAGRLLQQSSCFTLHTPPIELNDARVNEIIPLPIPGVKKYLIPKDAKRNLLLVLRRLGINYATLFHDVDHVAKELKCAWNL